MMEYWIVWSSALQFGALVYFDQCVRHKFSDFSRKHTIFDGIRFSCVHLHNRMTG